jgi:PAS domain S-box-containing protein
MLKKEAKNMEDCNNCLVILQELPDIVYRLDPNGYFTFVNKSVQDLGYEPDELIGKHFSAIVYPDDVLSFGRKYVLPKYKDKKTGDKNAPKLFDERRTGKRKTTELIVRLVPKNDKRHRKIRLGKVIAFGEVSSSGHYTADVHTKGKKFLGTLGIIRDITERKENEEKLHFQADLLKNVGNAIISTDLQWHIRTWNRAAENLYDRKIQEVSGKSLVEVIKSQILKADQEKIKSEIMKKGCWVGELVQEQKDGSGLIAIAYMSQIKDPTGGVIGIAIVEHDITESKKAEKENLLHLKDISFLLETAITFVEHTVDFDIYGYICDTICGLVGPSVVFVNAYDKPSGMIIPRCSKGMGELAQKTQKLLGKSPHDIKYPPSSEAMEQLLTGKLVEVPGGLYNLALGKIAKPICLTIEKLYNVSNIYAIGFAWEGRLYGNASIILRGKTDIENRYILETFVRQASIALQRRQAELKLRDALGEKEILLREIHHRVKNNLQVVASLLRLHADQTHDERDMTFFQDSETRIRSMALVHETLYGSEDLAHISAKQYFEKLIQYVRNFYAALTSNVKLVVHIANVMLDIEAAAPCGLILTELVSNAFKYAFPGRTRQGAEIKITFAQRNNGCVLRVADNGIGLSKALDIQKARTLGLQLVSILIQQLEGSLKVKRHNGTTFTITFPRKGAGVKQL